MFDDSFAVGIINRARKRSSAPIIHAAEIAYVIEHRELKPHEKHIWLKLACESAHDPSLCCTITPDYLSRVLNIYKEDVLTALLRLQDKDFVRLGLDIDLKLFSNINHLMGMGESREEIFSKINSVHCQLLLPKLGLMNVLSKPTNHLQLSISEYNNMAYPEW